MEEKHGNAKKPRAQLLLEDAFLDLLESKSFYDIRIKDIVEKATVARASFYVYYEDKFHLLRSFKEDLLQGFRNIAERLRYSFPRNAFKDSTDKEYHLSHLYPEYFNYLLDNERTFQLLLGPNGDGHFLGELMKYFLAEQLKTQKYWGINERIVGDHLNYLETIACYSYMGIIIRYLETPKELRPSPEEMGTLMSLFFTQLSTF